MPVDPEKLQEWIDTDAPADKEPRIVLILTDGSTVAGHQGSVLTPGARAFEGYTPHWATCPQRAQFKRKRGTA